MSRLVRDKIMSGAFPARAYLYGLRRFTRVNNIPSARVDALVEALSGKGLSTRELFVLWRTYFSGGPLIEQLITQGRPRRALQLLVGETAQRIEPSLDDTQGALMRELQAVATGIQRVEYFAAHTSVDGEEFTMVVNLACEKIQKKLNDFAKAVSSLYDRTRPT